MPKEDSRCICLSVVLIDFYFKIGENYIPQMFLETYKCSVKEKEVTRHITEKLEISSDSDECNENKLWGKFVFAKYRPFITQTEGKFVFIKYKLLITQAEGKVEWGLFYKISVKQVVRKKKIYIYIFLNTIDFKIYNTQHL